MENRQGRPPLIPLESILFDGRAKDLIVSRGGGAILIEVSIGDLQLSVQKKGFLGGDESFSKYSVGNFEFYWFSPKGEEKVDSSTRLVTRPKIFFFVKKNAEREEVYTLDEQFDRFKEFFLEEK